MKNLKLFEEFNDSGSILSGHGGHTIELSTRLMSTAYANDAIKEIDVDGFEVTLVTYNSSISGKTIFTVEVMSNTGSLSMSPKCFSELDTAKEYIKELIDDEELELTKDNEKFVIRLITLDNSPSIDWIKPIPMDNNEEQLDSTKIHDYIEKYINVLVDTYLAISTQRYKETFTKDLIRKGLVRLQQECKFNDLSRTKEAIKVFNDLMTPMMEDVHKSKNIETWKLGSNGKKYYSVFRDFRNMARLI